MPHLSRRGYARARGLSEASIRRHVSSGLLADAITSDDLIDSEVADRLLANSITRPKVVERKPAVLRTAQQRRLRAQVAILQDEVAESHRTLIEPADAAKLTAMANELVVASLRRIVDAAPQVAAQPGAVAYRLLDDAVQDCYVHFQSVMQPKIAEAERRKREEPSEPEVDLEALTPVELEALRAHLQAELLERQRALNNGDLVYIDDRQEADNEKAAVCKSMFDAIPGRLAQRLEHATEDEARAALNRELNQAIGVLQ